ncbi:hypothetical protein BC832DRAFT_297099 [Gaertneriomyces semiglobifer]|nr:hypothetical protein BC832DRAFT_297099 [Gaertneriomyces semiglobifer]
MSVRPRQSDASLRSRGEHSLESFNLEPGSANSQKGGFLSGLWKAVGRASEAASILPFGHQHPDHQLGARVVAEPSTGTTGARASIDSDRHLPQFGDTVSSGYSEIKARDSFDNDKHSIAGSVASTESELSNADTIRSGSFYEDSIRKSGVLPEDLEKNKSSLKLIRRLRNNGSSDSGITRDYWMKDERVKECYDCKLPFTTFRRKHHCRICGQIFCHKCASAIVPGDRFGYPGDMRVCNFCLRIMEDYRHYESASSLDHGFTKSAASPLPGSNKFPPMLPPAEPSKHATPAISITSPMSQHQSSGSVKAWGLSVSPDASIEGFKKMLGSTLFSNRRSTQPDEVTSTPRSTSATEPFRGALDPGKAVTESDSLNVMDPEIAPYITDDDKDDDIPTDNWTSTPLLNFPTTYASAAIATPIPALPLGSGIPEASNPTDSDSWDYGGTKGRKRRSNRRISRGDELRVEYTKEKLKRRSLSSGHPRPSRYSARAISRQISKSALVESLAVPFAEKAGSSLPVSDKISHVQPIPQNIELNAASLKHMRQLLRQVLAESQIPHKNNWEQVLMQHMLRVCDSIKPDVRAGDAIDVRHYVKIKKIPGGSPSDTEYVSGVVCSKNVSHKKMVKPIHQPKILLLTFAVEYQRVENQFLSLEPVLSQERDYLKNLVARIVAFKPDVVLVEKTVSRLAQEFFFEAGVTVAYNVKASVIEAIARCTRADIISSMDKLALEPTLGTCEMFTVKTFMNALIPGHRKSFMYFSGCAKELGCTIVLRGGTMETLSKVKRMADLMAFVVYNLKLETSLFRDEFAMAPTINADHGTSADSCEKPGSGSDSVMGTPTKAAESSPIPRLIRPYETTILSASPDVVFAPPYLLMRLKEEESHLTQHQRKQIVEKCRAEAAKSWSDSSNEFDDRDYVMTFLEQSSGWLSSIETRAGISNLLDSTGTLSPFGHQSIMVLYSNVCAATTIPCQAPEQHLIEYYQGTDMTLGQYLEELCCNADYLCPAKMCDRKMLMHFRSYAHGQGRVNVVIEDFASPIQGMEDTILMWSFCKICNQVTPVVPMSEETWKYSFGKYLELSYYHTQLPCRANMCPHDIFRDHIRYFALKNLAVRFEYEMIELLEVVVPPMRVRYNEAIASQLQQQNYEVLKAQIARYYDSLSERIKLFTYDIVPGTKLQPSKDAMAEMSKRVASERKYMLQLLQQTLISSLSTDMISLNACLRTLQDKVIQWDTDFNAFVRKYMQTDSKEIRRVTAAQLKRMFADREQTQQVAFASIPEDPTPLDTELVINPLNIDAMLPALGSSPTYATAQHFAGTTLGRDGYYIESPTANASRRMSLKFMNEEYDTRRGTMSTMPSVTGSPSLLLQGETYPSLSMPLPLASPAVQDNNTHELGSGPLLDGGPDELYASPNIFDPLSDETFSSIMRDMAKELAESATMEERAPAAKNRSRRGSVSSHSTSNALKDDEDDMPGEWNIISGVAGETLDPEDAPSDTRENRDIQSLAGERSSIMKTITSLWTGNAANLLPLEYPLAPTEHIFPDSNVVVREDEPSSIIAFTLDSKHYKEKLYCIRQGGIYPDTTEAGNSRVSVEVDEDYADITGTEETLLRGTGTHVRYQFWDGPTRMSCKIFFAEQFEALRRNCGVDENFIQSLARCMRWDALGGKSGSTFLKTRDDRLIIKQLSRLEMDALYKFAPAYFEYMSQAIFHELPTVLAKIFGFYRISFKNPTTGKSMRFDCFVMENLFYQRNIARIFDLKGSMRNRHVQSTGKQNEVLLDENLVEFIYESPLFIREHSKKLLRASVWNDTLFLSKLNVMDYSLLVGIDVEQSELVVGIVDFIRTFTWDKKLESWVKESGFLGGGKEPTIVSPRQYKNRFREAMERYFLLVPDKYVTTMSRGDPYITNEPVI